MSEMSEKLDYICSKATVDEVKRIETLSEAEKKALEELESNSTTDNITNWKKAKNVLDEYLRTLEEKYLSTTDFKNVSEVLEYLIDKKWKISSAKLYRDVKNGLLQKDENGHFSLDSVNSYAGNFLKKVYDNGDSDEAGDLSVQKLKQEIEIGEIKKRMLAADELRKKGEYVPKSQYAKDLGKRMAVFRSDLMALVYDSVPELVKMCNGDSEKVSGAIQFMKYKVHEIMRRYATGRIEYNAEITHHSKLNGDPDEPEREQKAG